MQSANDFAVKYEEILYLRDTFLVTNEKPNDFTQYAHTHIPEARSRSMSARSSGKECVPCNEATIP